MLSRDTGEDDPNPSGISGPAWREEQSDWVAHEEEFEPAMFGDDQDALGSLDETNRTAEERRPWEFDLPASGVTPAVSRPVDPAAHYETTGELPAVPAADSGSVLGLGSAEAADIDPDTGWALLEERPPVPTGRRGTGDPVAPAEPAASDPVEEVDDLPGLQRTRPTGTTRAGRVRRSMTGRVRAKRPEEMDALVDSSLAAEPPGASVTSVPGVGRRRGGVAGLAAADRSAGQGTDLATDTPDGSTGLPDPAATRAGPGHGPGGGRRARRRAGRRPPRPPPAPSSPRTTAPAAATSASGSAPASPWPWWGWPPSPSAP